MRPREVRILHIDDCPGHAAAEEATRRALESLGLDDVPVVSIRIGSAADAEGSGFAGSPTIQVDGDDLFAGAGSTGDLACRVYVTDHGLAPAPTAAQIEVALRTRFRRDLSTRS